MAETIPSMLKIHLHLNVSMLFLCHTVTRCLHLIYPVNLSQYKSLVNPKSLTTTSDVPNYDLLGRELMRDSR